MLDRSKCSAFPTPEFVQLRKSVTHFSAAVWSAMAELAQAVQELPQSKPLVVDGRELKDTPSSWLEETISRSLIDLDRMLTILQKATSVDYATMLARVIDCHRNRPAGDGVE